MKITNMVNVNIKNKNKNKNRNNKKGVSELNENFKKKLNNFIKREHNIIEDANNMYLTPESKEDQEYSR